MRTSAPQIVCPSALVQGNLSALERQVDDAILRKAELVTIDLNAVESAESAGLEWLLTAQSRLAAQGIHLVLRRLSPMMTDVLVATRLDTRFQIELAQEAVHA